MVDIVEGGTGRHIEERARSLQRMNATALPSIVGERLKRFKQPPAPGEQIRHDCAHRLVGIAVALANCVVVEYGQRRTILREHKVNALGQHSFIIAHVAEDKDDVPAVRTVAELSCGLVRYAVKYTA